METKYRHLRLNCVFFYFLIGDLKSISNAGLCVKGAPCVQLLQQVYQTRRDSLSQLQLVLCARNHFRERFCFYYNRFSLELILQIQWNWNWNSSNWTHRQNSICLCEVARSSLAFVGLNRSISMFYHSRVARFTLFPRRHMPILLHIRPQLEVINFCCHIFRGCSENFSFSVFICNKVWLQKETNLHSVLHTAYTEKLTIMTVTRVEKHKKKLICLLSISLKSFKMQRTYVLSLKNNNFSSSG